MEDKLLQERIIFINGEINDTSAYDTITKLLYLDSENNEKISLYINSPGGSVVEGLAIIDTMNYIKSDVDTYCIGKAYSMGAMILSCGKTRYALENSEIMIHSPSTSMEGKAEQIELSTERLKNTKKKLIEILYKKTNKTKKEIDKNFQKDTFMTSKEAKEFGIIDKILKSY